MFSCRGVAPLQLVPADVKLARGPGSSCLPRRETRLGSVFAARVTPPPPTCDPPHLTLGPCRPVHASVGLALSQGSALCLADIHNENLSKKGNLRSLCHEC